MVLVAMNITTDTRYVYFVKQIVWIIESIRLMSMRQQQDYLSIYNLSYSLEQGLSTNTLCLYEENSTAGESNP